VIRIGDKVVADGSDLPMLVTAILTRRHSVQMECKYFFNGDQKETWVEDWRLTPGGYEMRELDDMLVQAEAEAHTLEDLMLDAHRRGMKDLTAAYADSIMRLRGTISLIKRSRR
jgi:hypothetical protein